jgi:copper transport protein
MKIARLVYALALLACGAAAVAHTHLTKSVPADGSTVTVSPPKFVLTFAEPARLTAMSIQKDSAPAKKLAPLPAAAAGEIAVTAPQLAAGKYVLTWRALSDDGHVMPGKISFTVAPSGAPTSAPGVTGAPGAKGS